MSETPSAYFERAKKIIEAVNNASVLLTAEYALQLPTSPGVGLVGIARAIEHLADAQSILCSSLGQEIYSKPPTPK